MLDVWGFDLVKLDFLYAVCMLPTEYKTRGQIMCEAMDFLREVIGDTAAMDKVTDSSLIYELDSRGYNVDNLIEILHKIKS